MKKRLGTFLFAVRESLSSGKDKLRFAVLTGFLFWLLVMIPVWTTPGNDFLFQLEIAGPAVAVLMIVLSTLNGLLLSMHWHIHRVNKGVAKLEVKHTAGGVSSIASALVATIGCASCYSSLLAIFGAGSVGLLVEYRWLVALVALGITSTAIGFTAKRIKHGCNVCTAS